MSPQLQDTLGMFAFLTLELSVLFIGISLLVGVLQRHIPPSKVEALLSSNGSRGYFLAAAHSLHHPPTRRAGAHDRC